MASIGNTNGLFGFALDPSLLDNPDSAQGGEVVYGEMEPPVTSTGGGEEFTRNTGLMARFLAGTLLRDSNEHLAQGAPRPWEFSSERGPQGSGLRASVAADDEGITPPRDSGRLELAASSGGRRQAPPSPTIRERIICYIEGASTEGKRAEELPVREAMIANIQRVIVRTPSRAFYDCPKEAHFGDIGFLTLASTPISFVAAACLVVASDAYHGLKLIHAVAGKSGSARLLRPILPQVSDDLLRIAYKAPSVCEWALSLAARLAASTPPQELTGELVRAMPILAHAPLSVLGVLDDPYLSMEVLGTFAQMARTVDAASPRVSSALSHALRVLRRENVGAFVRLASIADEATDGEGDASVTCNLLEFFAWANGDASKIARLRFVYDMWSAYLPPLIAARTVTSPPLATQLAAMTLAQIANQQREIEEFVHSPGARRLFAAFLGRVDGMQVLPERILIYLQVFSQIAVDERYGNYDPLTGEINWREIDVNLPGEPLDELMGIVADIRSALAREGAPPPPRRAQWEATARGLIDPAADSEREAQARLVQDSRGPGDSSTTNIASLAISRHVARLVRSAGELAEAGASDKLRQAVISR